MRRTRLQLILQERLEQFRQTELEHVDAGVRLDEIVCDPCKALTLWTGHAPQRRKDLLQDRQTQHRFQAVRQRRGLLHDRNIGRADGLCEQFELPRTHLRLAAQQERQYECLRVAGGLRESPQILGHRQTQRLRLLDMQRGRLTDLGDQTRGRDAPQTRRRHPENRGAYCSTNAWERTNTRERATPRETASTSPSPPGHRGRDGLRVRLFVLQLLGHLFQVALREVRVQLLDALQNRRVRGEQPPHPLGKKHMRRLLRIRRRQCRTVGRHRDLHQGFLEPLRIARELNPRGVGEPLPLP